MAQTATRSLMREAGTAARVTNVELFFDLVYVFAVTQLSHHLLAHATVTGALDTLVLLAMVWLAWVYTTWVTNWLDPDRIPVRGLLVALMLVSLVMSAALPDAYGDRGLGVGVAYAVMQVGRSVFAVAALRGEPLQRNFERILAWCVVSGALAVAGGLASGQTRAWLWLAAVLVDLCGGAVGFYTPGIGRSRTTDWPVDGSHFAERCQAFLIIALGESIVVIGATLADLQHVTLPEVVAFCAAFLGSVALWWLYFDRSAEGGAAVIAASADPGRLSRSAYHQIHPIMVAGIIVTAAADQRVLSHPGVTVDGSTAAMVLGGPAIFLAGHAAFKATVWRVVPWSRLAAVAALAAVGVGLIVAPVTDVVLAVVAAVVVTSVAVADRTAAKELDPEPRPEVSSSTGRS